MTEPIAPSPRPVPLITVLFIMVCCGLFLALVWIVYLPHRPPPPQDVAAEKLSADQTWQATPAARKAYLLELRAHQEKQSTSYAWINQKAGVVQLPIDRAMDLVVQQYGAKPAAAHP